MNKHGEFVWYELMTRDVAAARKFYQEVVGWNVIDQEADGGGYPTLAAGDDYVGGIFSLSDDMCEQGARPVWLGYVGVDDVDSAARKVEELGGKVLMPPSDIPDVGRFAMVADPQEIPFYIMRGAMEGTSEAFSPDAVGHCSWNELITPGQDEAIAFYSALLNWESRESMPISDTAEYKFLHHRDLMIGAVSPCTDLEERKGWTFYFRVVDIHQAAQKIKDGGGKVMFGPHEVPGDDYILIASDPEGVTFGLAASK